MTKDEKKILASFQCEFNRAIEETFSQTLSERNDVRLFFINENQAFTDGRNIIVDPAWNELFADTKALVETENYLKLDHIVSADRWVALRMATRAQNIHETLHILYSNFPGGSATDKRSTTKARKLVLSLIDNIIEDAFIEAAGCSIYDNLERYLLWHRVAICCSNMPSQGTVERAFSEMKPSEEDARPKELEPIVVFLSYMAGLLLYPMIRQDAPSEDLREYVESTRELFVSGSICGVADERYSYTQQIFDIIEALIPDSDAIDISSLERMLDGGKTHLAENTSIKTIHSKGKSTKITRRLFTDENGRPADFSKLQSDFAIDIDRFKDEEAAAIKIVTYKGSLDKIHGSDFDCANIHKGITIEVKKPRINLNLKKAYQNIYSNYHINITAYNSRFSQLLKGTVDVKEDKHLFGSGISSKDMGDIKKRYWYRNTKGTGVPDIAVLLLIDGSGSMSGNRRDGAIISSVVLHEVLRKNNIEHAIVEHRAIYDKPILKHNILVDFNALEEEKYNLLTLDAEEGTREGLSLFWAERYLQEHSFSENKLIIMLSDGVPAHGLDGDACYVPPVSIKDTHNAVQKITKRGIQIIAIALDTPGDDSCYAALKEMYPSVISCTDLRRLTGQLLGLISKGLG